MYRINVYTPDGVFKYTLSNKEVSSNYSFSAVVGGSFWSFSFAYRGTNSIGHRDRIQLFKNDVPIYVGYVTKVHRQYNGEVQRITLSCSGLMGLLTAKQYAKKTASGAISDLLRECFDQIPWLTYYIHDYPKTISLTTDNMSYHDLLKEIMKYTQDRGLFIDAQFGVYFEPYQTHHLLTYKKDCVNISIDEDSTSYYNKVTLLYGSVALSQVVVANEEEIVLYGEAHRIISDERISNQETALLRAEAELEKSKIVKNCKIVVNNNYPFASMKPWHILSIRNTEHHIRNQKIKQIQYDQNTATITLEHYQSLEHLISTQQ